MDWKWDLARFAYAPIPQVQIAMALSPTPFGWHLAADEGSDQKSPMDSTCYQRGWQGAVCPRPVNMIQHVAYLRRQQASANLRIHLASNDLPHLPG